MWARKQLTSLRLVLAVVFFLVMFYSTKSVITEQATQLSLQYSNWTNPPALAEELPKSVEIVVDETSILETKLPGGAPAPGYTIFDRLYVRSGTFYAVTSHPSAFPELKYVISIPQDMKAGKYDPTDKEMQIISPEQAKVILGDRAVVLKGMTVIFYDTKQFMAHYYHWWGELMLGAIRVYSSLSLVSGIQGRLPEISRFLIPHIHNHDWRDRAGVDGPLMRAAFPLASIEQGHEWEDLIAFDNTFVFEHAMIVSRIGAHKSPLAGLCTKMIGSAMNMTVPDRFWEPVRQRVVENSVGYIPIVNDFGLVQTTPNSSLPVVTYIPRQKTGRRLLHEDHEGLVKALLELEEEGHIELNIAHMETLTLAKQIETVARSSIIVGVHGNGLTHQLWMPPSPVSTVIEIMYPGDFLYDYEMLSRNVGHMHYAVWNDTTHTIKRGEWEKIHVADGKLFHGSSIPVHGPTVAQTIRRRLSFPEQLGVV